MDIVERWGRIFKRVNYGLDEEQVTSFINELIRERDMLIKQQEHLFSLIRLAERAIGADNVAKQSQKEATDEAKEQTRPIIGEKKPEAIAMPTRGAEVITANAQHQFQKLIENVDQITTGEPEPEWEVQILPPIDIMQALGIMTSLDNLPEIEKTELIPDINKPSIAVFVRKPIHLVDALRTLPQVAEVKEGAADEAGAYSKSRKVQIVLSLSSTPS